VQHKNYLVTQGLLEEKKRKLREEEFKRLVEEQVKSYLKERMKKRFDEILERVRDGELDPYSAVDLLYSFSMIRVMSKSFSILSAIGIGIIVLPLSILLSKESFTLIFFASSFWLKPKLFLRFLITSA
jgi:hypothetical protein